VTKIEETEEIMINLVEERVEIERTKEKSPLMISKSKTRENTAITNTEEIISKEE